YGDWKDDDCLIRIKISCVAKETTVDGSFFQPSSSSPLQKRASSITEVAAAATTVDASELTFIPDYTDRIAFSHSELLYTRSTLPHSRDNDKQYAADLARIDSVTEARYLPLQRKAILNEHRNVHFRLNQPEALGESSKSPNNY